MTDTLRSLLAAATPPPWEQEQNAATAAHTWPNGTLEYRTVFTARFVADAALIVWFANHAEVLAELWEAAKDALAAWDLVKSIEYRGDDQRALADPMIAIRETLAKLEVTRSVSLPRGRSKGERNDTVPRREAS